MHNVVFMLGILLRGWLSRSRPYPRSFLAQNTDRLAVDSVLEKQSFSSGNSDKGTQK